MELKLRRTGSSGLRGATFSCDSKPSGKLAVLSDVLQGWIGFYFSFSLPFISFSFASFLCFFDGPCKWCSREIINMIGGSWRAEKAIGTKATWEFAETWEGL